VATCDITLYIVFENNLVLEMSFIS